MKTTQAWIGVALGAILWFLMFSPWTSPRLDFWNTMTFSAAVLIIYSTFTCREWLKDIHFSLRQILLGVAIAIILWCIFWIGDKVSQWIFDFARPQVNSIYAMKSGAESWSIAVRLLFIIGPAEEIFWRGFIQRRFSQRWNPNVGFIVTLACYTLIHIWSFNFMLVMAAMTVGFCWGVIYRLKPNWLTALIISHALWDAAAFVFFPF